MKPGIRRFFSYARERHAITLRRAAGAPRERWTKDPILAKYRFTCVFRELDRTTQWFRKYVRDPLRNKPDVLLATVLFRMFNRIETAEAMFCQTFISDEGDVRTAWDKFLIDGNVAHLRFAIKRHIGKTGPYVTGSYIISSPPGYSKLDGMLEVVGRFRKGKHTVDDSGLISTYRWDTLADALLNNRGEWCLEHVWNWLREFDYFGDFHSYEIVTDLRHTALLDRAPDIMTWANPGPGANRGANRVHGRDKDKRNSKEQLNSEMQNILSFSRDSDFWPRNKDHPRWEMRDVEHTLCEFDKYERVRLGEGRPRGVYR